ncbi:hypothetical protein WA1_49275 [Scytonema hofmannii PCC 7110]|uniref:Staphylococcus aureus surface protein A n=1 Tax=Scytonema hofmannii PCC 7110 TaxID=128403 RepID=A0A139WQN3_9CYAN|nr:putative Ig domain-containing protein [Scytonema hofmannii]KYC34733.1 hypothetical protein WA1_49275 [Scytonema hofmannii PCC 7110]
MVRPVSFFTNGASHNNDSLLPQSLLESASLVAPLDDNSFLLDWQKTPKTPSGADLLTSQLDRQKKADTTSDNTEDITNSNTQALNPFDQPLLFKQQPYIYHIPSQRKKFKSHKEKDILTGGENASPLISSSQADTLTSTNTNQRSKSTSSAGAYDESTGSTSLSFEPPRITSFALVNDTAPGGTTNTDKITSDLTTRVSVPYPEEIYEWKAGFNNTPEANYVNILPYLQSTGVTIFDRTALNTIYGSSLPDGTHVLYLLTRRDEGEFVSVSKEPFTFTQDTTPPPQPAFNLDAASDSGTVGDKRTSFSTVTLVGQTEASASVKLEQTGATITADSTGKFTFTNVSLTIGDNPFTVRATDKAGNQQTFSTTIKRISPPTAINLTSNTVAENSAIGTVIGQLSSTDPDVGDNHIYSLVNDGGRRFKIVGNQLQVANDTLLNFENLKQHSIEVRSTDLDGLTKSQIFTINVTNVNEAPTFTSKPSTYTGAVGSAYSYSITTTDQDTGDTRKITAINPPSWLKLVDNGNGTATLSGTPTTNGIFNVDLKVEDVGKASSIQSFPISVIPNITLAEGKNFATTHTIPFTIPTNPSLISFNINPQFDTKDLDSIKDAFEVALVDEAGNSLVHTVSSGRDAFFNWTEGEAVALGVGTTYNSTTRTVSLNLTGTKPLTNAKLIFRLVNDDKDTTTNVSITSFAINPAPVGTLKAVQKDFDTQALPSTSTTPNFNVLADVSNSFLAEYHRTSFNADTKLLHTDIALRNTGKYSVDGPLLVGVTHISDPTVTLHKPDGITPEGIPYYDFSQLVSDGKVEPLELTNQRSLTFYNPQGKQFTYDLVVLAQLNQKPSIQSQPVTEIIGGQQYRYDVDATDPNSDVLTYKLLSSPVGTTIDSKTGLITWNTLTTNKGNHTILVEANDSRGEVTTQQFTLSVIDAPPNRPPVFTSTPIVDAAINTNYTYQAIAFDADRDTLTFSLVNKPEGMTVNPSTGVVSWTPNGNQLDTYDVTLAVTDGKSGTAQQVFKVKTQMEPGNHAPIIIGNPITQFGITNTNTVKNSTVSTIVRDFRMYGTDGGHPDFETFTSSYQNMVSQTIGSDRTPVFIGSNGYGATSAETFKQWYRDVAGVNSRIDIPMTLTETASGSGVWQYANDFFFPIDNLGFGNQGYSNNYAFTLESHVNFTYKGGEVFNFTGDDDVWVFINDKLVIDLGGIHSPASASVALDTLGLIKGESYTLDLFFAERHTYGSGFAMQTSLDFGPKYTYKLNVADADKDSLKYELIERPFGMTVSKDGVIEWRPKLSQQGIHKVTVKVTDGRGGVTTQSFNLNITPSNPGEIRGTVYRDANANGIQNTGEVAQSGRTVYIDENQNNFRDIEEVSVVTDAYGNYKFTNLASGSYKIGIEPKDGWNVTGGIGAVILGSGQILYNHIGTLEAKDSSLNQNPYFTTQPTVTQVEAGKVFKYEAAAKDPDSDGITYNVVVGNQQGITIDKSTGIVSWQPTHALIGSTVDVVLQAKDPYGGVVLQAFQLQVIAANTAPVFTLTPTQELTATVNNFFQYQFAAIDAQGDPITYTLESPNGATIDSKTGVFSWKPTALGQKSFTVVASDGKGGVTKHQFSLTAVSSTSNQIPIITSTPRNRVALGQSYLYTVKASDSNNDPLTYTLATAPVGMTIDSTGKILWTPDPKVNPLGANPVKVQIGDGRGGIQTQSFSIDVVSTPNRTNNAPTITSIPPLDATVGTTYRYNLTALDPDNDSVAWKLDKAPEGMSIDSERGILVWTPRLDQVGEREVVVQVVDALGGFSIQEFSITTRGVNAPPQIISTPITRAAINRPYTYKVVATDPEDDFLTFSLGNNKPTGMTIDSNTGVIQWTPGAAQPVSVEAIVTDIYGATNSQTFSIMVGTSPINNAPSITSTPIFKAGVGKPYSYQVQATDPDAGDTLTYELISRPSTEMKINPTTGLITWASPFSTTYDVVVGVRDAGGMGAAQRFPLISRSNTAPNVTSTPVTSATPNTLYAYDIKATDAEGDSLSYSLDTASLDRGMKIDAFGRLRWTPTLGQITTTTPHKVTVTVSDDNGGSKLHEFNITVAADTIKPQATLIANTDSAKVGSEVTFLAKATDNIKVASLQLLVNGTVVQLDPNGMAKVKMTQTGNISAIAKATDTALNEGQSATWNVLVTNPNPNNPPPNISLNLSNIPNGIVTAPTNIIGTVSDDNLINYILEVAPLAGGEFKTIGSGTTTVSNNVLGKFDPSLLQNDTYRLRLSAYDASGNGRVVEETIDVAGELKLGNFRLSFTDLTVPVTGIPITLTRTYDTLTDNTTDDFGYGWRMEFRDTDLRTSLRPPSEEDQLLGYQSAFKDGTRVYITLPGGKREAFTFKPTLDPIFKLAAAIARNPDAAVYRPAFVGDKGVTSTLTVKDAKILHKAGTSEYVGLNGGVPYNPADVNYGGIYVLTTKEGIVYEIDANTGDLLTVTDTNGNKLTYTDGGIYSSTGKQITFERDAQGRIASVKDPMGYLIKYDYDAKGDLIAVTDRENNTTRFEYGSKKQHYLDNIIDPLGRTGVRNNYNELTGRLKSMVDVNGKQVEITYESDNSKQTVLDQLGNPTTYVYDTRGNIVTEIDALGKMVNRKYNDDNYAYEETVISDRSSANGFTTKSTYDNQGNKLTEEDSLGNITRYTYGANSRLLTQTDPLGRTTTNTYSKSGNLLSTTDATGKITTYSYDLKGQLLSVTDALQQTTRFTYDLSGNVETVTDALNKVTAYTYNVNGDKLTETRTRTTPTGVQTLLTQWTYDKEGHLRTMTDAENRTTTYEYDKQGRQTAVIDALARRTEYVYNEKGELVETIYPDNTSTTLDDNPRIKTKYDAAGRQIETIDQLGRVTRYIYDKVGRLRFTVYPDKTPDDQNLSPELWDNPKTETIYYTDGLVKAQIDERGNRTEFRYDAVGQQTEIIYADDTPANLLDNPKTIYKYDKAGQQIAVTDALNHTTAFVYDDLGRLKETRFHDKSYTTQEYDALGRRIATIDQNRKPTEYRYDALGRLTGVKNALGDWTEYGYDEVGNLIWMEDALDRRTNYEYDKLGRRTAVIEPMGQRSDTTYDAVGNLKTYTDFNRRTITYDYDPQNRMTSKLFGDGSKVTYTYTNTGLQDVVKFINASSVTTATYDSDYDERSRLIQRTDTMSGVSRSISYTYDAASNRTSVTTPSGTVNYTFDKRNRLDRVIENNIVTADYDYDGVSNLVLTKFANGTQEIRHYDDLNRLESLENKKASGDIISSYTYTLDAGGNRTKVVEHNGRTVEYTYDDLYRLTQEKITDTVNGNRIKDYTYDKVGNRKTLKEAVNGVTTVTEYNYDNNDRLQNEKVNQVVVASYTYDNNGNTLMKTENGMTSTYTWDYENRLGAATLKNSSGIVLQSMQYRYNDNGIRVASVVNNQETRYLIDTVQPYGQVLEEYSPNGAVQVSYTYGNDLISQKQGIKSTFYHVDGLGSTRALTDASGSVVNTYNYEAYGELLNSTGSVSNKYMFAGEQYDSNLGDYYLRQRYYDTETGRFTRRDDYEGRLGEPQTLHKYVYAHDNPVNGIDPTGLFTLLELGRDLSIVGILASIPTYTPGIITGSSTRDSQSSDDVIVYVGAGSSNYALGHAFIEVDGIVYTFPGGRYTGADRNHYMHEQQEEYDKLYRHSVNYTPAEKKLLKLTLETKLDTTYKRSGKLRDGGSGDYVTGIPYYDSYANNCTTFVTESLPSKGSLFNIVKAQYYPFGLSWALDTIQVLSRGSGVKKLTSI